MIQRLSPREQEVLYLRCQGQTLAEIANRLSIDHPTALSLLDSIYRKLGLISISRVEREEQLDQFHKVLETMRRDDDRPQRP
jgi:DNA-binding CsgD family transcriptional regulator